MHFRRIRDRPNEPFGGVVMIAAGNVHQVPQVDGRILSILDSGVLEVKSHVNTRPWTAAVLQTPGYRVVKVQCASYHFSPCALHPRQPIMLQLRKPLQAYEIVLNTYTAPY
jgi:hypothetical protein